MEESFGSHNAIDIKPTPQSRLEVGVGMSSSPYTESPTSFHTADPMENDYQYGVIVESLPSSPPTGVPHSAFYSDGRPRPVPHDSDEESHDSFEDGGYITAAQIPATHRFADPDQPKLLLAEDDIPPSNEKQPLLDALAPPPTQVHPQRRARSQDCNENTPLLTEGQDDKSQDKDRGCCHIL